MQTDNHLWFPPPTALILADNEVHVWRAQLHLPASQVQQLRDILTADELDRADHFAFEKDKQHFIAARGTLRSILSRYTNIQPSHVRFCYNSYGKPLLASRFDQYLLNFNLSHSDGMALYAITRNREIGIDLERIRSDFQYEEIAERFFSPREVAVLHTIQTELRLEAFFNCWTRKEAYIKAHGQGLSLPLDSFDVSFAPWEPPMLLITKDESQEASRWTLQELRPGHGYVGAVAVKGRGCRFRYWQWKQPV
jgi:Phosphopantetheinyl transferase